MILERVSGSLRFQSVLCDVALVSGCAASPCCPLLPTLLPTLPPTLPPTLLPTLPPNAATIPAFFHAPFRVPRASRS